MSEKNGKKTGSRPDPDTLRVKGGELGTVEGMNESQMVASVVSRSGLAAVTLRAYSNQSGEVQATDMLAELVKAGDEIVAGDMGRMERMLAHQAITLDTMFNTLAKRSASQEYMKQMEAYMRLALKAQAQARATVEAMALLKNPQPYIRQANIAHGNQQINNTYARASGHSGMVTRPISAQYAQAPAPAGKPAFVPNKLLEEPHAERLDIGAQGAAGRANPHLEAVGAINRPHDPRG
jgi:hypothetical protein